MFKVKRDLCPGITGNIFIDGTNYCCNLRYIKLVKSVYHRTESIAYLETKIRILCVMKLRKNHR